MENQLKETLEVEKSARTMAEKSRIELSKELETLRAELEESMDMTAASQHMRQKPGESELVALKKSIKEEALVREVAMSQLKQKHTQLVEELNEKLETTKKGKALLEKAKNHLEEENSHLRTDAGELTTQKTKAEHKIKVLENQMADANARLADNQVKMQKELKETNDLVDELESKCSDVETVKASPESQLADMQFDPWLSLKLTSILDRGRQTHSTNQFIALSFHSFYLGHFLYASRLVEVFIPLRYISNFVHNPLFTTFYCF